MQRLVTTALLLSLSGGPALASPVDLFGFGARGQGLANAHGASASGSESVYYNPAALAYELRPTFALGYQIGTLGLKLDGASYETRDAPALSLGFGVPIPFGGALKERLTLGMGFVIPQTSVLIADIARPSVPSFVLLENRAQTVSIQAALGIRITDFLSIGVGTLALAGLQGEVKVAPSASGRIGSTVKDELIADYALVAGALVRLLPSEDGARHGLRLGLSYRGESRADFNLPITADLGSDFSIPIPPLNVRGTSQYDAPRLALDLAASPVHWLSISASLSYDLWSNFPLPIEYSAVPEDYPAQPEANFSDVLSVKLGVEGDFHMTRDASVRFQPRLGFAYHPSPAPEQSGFHNHLDNDRMLFALGFGLRWANFRLDLAGQYHLLNERTHTKVAPYDTDHPGSPSLTHGGNLFFGALELGVTL